MNIRVNNKKSKEQKEIIFNIDNHTNSEEALDNVVTLISLLNNNFHHKGSTKLCKGSTKLKEKSEKRENEHKRWEERFWRRMNYYVISEYIYI